MESVLGRYRNLIILVLVLFVQVFGLAVQVKRSTDTEPTLLIRIWAVSAVTPFEKALVWTQNSTRNIWHNYIYLRGVRQENRDLKAEIERLRIERVRLNEDAEQARRLQALLSFKEQFISQTLPAQVIGASGSEQSRSVYIDKGAKEGITRDMAVITADGVVGKVLQVFKSTSLVLLISDQTSGVGAILEKSRLQGIVRGTAVGEVTLDKVMSDEQVQSGEKLLTSGGDQVFPKGLPLGTVKDVSKGNDLFLNIRIKPAANLTRLEEVLVITKKEERQAVAEESAPMRAADILAQRLPSVPDKPPADEAEKAKATASGGATPDATSPTAVPAKPPVVKPNTGGPLPGPPSDGTRTHQPPSEAKPKPTATSPAPKPESSSPATPAQQPTNPPGPPPQ